MREIDHHSETPVYRQVADALREEIDAGRLAPRRPLPSETHLQQEFGVARDTVRRAIALLADLGLVRTVPGRGTYVRARAVTSVALEPGMRVITRPATEAERTTMEIGEGVWVLVVEWPDGQTEVLPGDEAEIRVAE
ncbi:GntR family transcriptional regulator [Planobispora siamensis]|uniref:GntR family transcriptional regulator n=1 Tax=Planobispora siamensis TaxID=936338 RepID=UPI001EF2A59F|nr:GntR family transcriptional regulator [Planobispora siamensis]